MDVRKMMITKSKFAFMAALAAVAVASPAAAQPLRDTANGAAFEYPTAPIRKSGHHLYNMSEPALSAHDSNSPQATGGGSLGYNQNLYNY
jgi:hypothetical protein